MAIFPTTKLPTSILVMASVFPLVQPRPCAAEPDLKTDGVFGFPQKDAKVLCDTRDLRLSAFNDSQYLFVQAILWHDHGESLGETDDGRKIGDSSALNIDVDADKQITPDVDRNYLLNAWPSLPGLHYVIELGNRASTGLKPDSKGHGSIQYVECAGKKKKVRVDSYVIPLAELDAKTGHDVRLAFWATSPADNVTLNSIGYESEAKYYSFNLPLKDYHSFKLIERKATIDLDRVPEGRKDIGVDRKKPAKMPKQGSPPPEVSAGSWNNWTGDKPPSLKSLKGKVVCVEFWATWCGPCVTGIPHLNELHAKHGKDGLVILALADQSAGPIGRFVKDKGMKYVVGAASQSADAYGVSAIPHAFLIGRDGKLVWHGNPNSEEFDRTVEECLKATP